MKYFAYGSNLNNEDLKKWCKKRMEIIPKLNNPVVVKLEDFAIGFTRKSRIRGGGVADIISKKGDFCYGVTFDVSEQDFDILDKKEGVKKDGSGAYRRLALPNNMITYEVVKKKQILLHQLVNI